MCSHYRRRVSVDAVIRERVGSVCEPLQCEAIVEQNEDEIIEYFSHETDNVKDKLCSKRTGQNSLLSLPRLPVLLTLYTQGFRGNVFKPLAPPTSHAK